MDVSSDEDDGWDNDNTSVLTLGSPAVDLAIEETIAENNGESDSGSSDDDVPISVLQVKCIRIFLFISLGLT